MKSGFFVLKSLFTIHYIHYSQFPPAFLLLTPGFLLLAPALHSLLFTLHSFPRVIRAA